jgi:hypothetical protein
MTEHIGWKNENGCDLNGLMAVVSALSEKEANYLRIMIRQYGITSPQELLFFPSTHYLRMKNVGKIFFFNLKKALYENGIPYDGDNLEMINKKIKETQSRAEANMKLRFEILERDNFTCQYCGRSPRFNKDVVLEMDHKYPASKGGEWSKENIITSCRDCNGGKSDILLKEISK